ncbi:hypothetical protein BDW62DRAFT_201308 [Aspergillus aurantiobrunneus]
MTPPSSFPSLFFPCIQIRKNKKGRHNPNPISPSSHEEKHGCKHTTALPSTHTCTCTDTTPGKEPHPNPNTIAITQTTSIRIVESDSSSDYDSAASVDLDSDSNTLSEYGCHCGGNLDHDYQTCENESRPLPPLPTETQDQYQIQRTASRKHPEIKTRLIEETIPEEDEDEYLQKQQQQQQEQESKRHKRTTSRRKSMIGLFNLSTAPFQSSRPCSSSSGLSLSFSNLHFKFPLPPAWGQQTHASQQQEDGQREEQAQDCDERYYGRQEQSPKAERRRPMSMSALSSTTTPASTFTSISASLPRHNSKMQDGAFHKTQTTTRPNSTPDSGLTKTTTATTTKKERRMGTILFSPLGLLSRSASARDNSNRESTGSASGRSLFP